MPIMNIASVEPSELKFAMALGSAAAANKIPNSGVGGMGVDLEFDEDDVRRIELTDIPINRAMIAIRNQFPSEKFQPLVLRAWALGSLLNDELMKPYIRNETENGEFEMSEAVLDIAAVMPLNEDAEFNRKTFFKRVEKRFQELGGHED